MKKGRLILLAALAALLAFAAVFLFGRQGVYYQHRELTRRAAEIAAGRHAIDSLTEVIRRLEHDTACIERVAREKLGMARPDETVYQFVEKKK